MKARLWLIPVFMSGFLRGQADSSTVYRNQIKLSPVRLITFVRGIQVSYERQIAGRFTIQVTGCHIVDLWPYHPLDLKDMKGYAYGIEPKYYMRVTKEAGDYLSADFTVLNCSVTRVAGFSSKAPADSIATFYSDTIGIVRRTATLSVKYGAQFNVRRFVIDLSIGLGLRNRDVIHINKLHPESAVQRSIEPNVPYELFREGKYTTLNIPLGLKVGCRF